MPSPKVIARMAIPDAQLLDIAGPLDVISEANALPVGITTPHRREFN